MNTKEKIKFPLLKDKVAKKLFTERKSRLRIPKKNHQFSHRYSYGYD